MASYELSAVEIKALTNWPGPVIEDYLDAIRSINELIKDASSVRGIVSAVGVGTGSGFTSSRTSLGIFPIVFTIEKDSANYIALPVATTDGHIATYSGKAKTGFTVRITDSTGALADSEFNFMVKE